MLSLECFSYCCVEMLGNMYLFGCVQCIGQLCSQVKMVLSKHCITPHVIFIKYKNTKLRPPPRPNRSLPSRQMSSHLQLSISIQYLGSIPAYVVTKDVAPRRDNVGRRKAQRIYKTMTGPSRTH